MKKTLNEKSRIFEINYYDLSLKFELFSIDYIFDELIKLEHNNVCSINRLTIPEKKPFQSFKEIYYEANNDEEKYHYFAYIKFFKFEEQPYGLVGGKTNYPHPDIRFDSRNNKDDKRISRIFLEKNNLEWHNEIIIVNHEAFLNDRKKDNQQALYLESFLQRKFNLFNS